MVRRILILVSLSVALLLGNSLAQDEPRTLEVAYAGTLSTWDPHTGRHGTEHKVLWAVFDALIRFDETLSLEPGLAESYEFTDETTFELTLRPGLTFHDGTPLDAEAVKWNIDRQLDPETGAVTAAELAPIEEVEVVDDTTVVFHLSEPMASLPAILTDRAGMMLSPTAAETFGEDIGQNPVGAGPYVFSEYVPDSYWILDKFDDFWEAEAVDIERIRFNRFSNAAVAMQAVRSGEIHFFQGIPADALDWVEQSPNYELLLDPTVAFYMLYVDAATEPFNNLALRQAFAHAIDREVLAEVFGGPEAEPANGLWPQGYWAQSPDVEGRQYDPEMVAQKLEEARASGYNGEPLSLIVYSTGIYPSLGQAIHGMLVDAGINATISIGDNSAQSTKFEEGGHAVKLSSWTGRTDPDQTASGLLRSDGGTHLPRGKYVGDARDEELDNMIDEARQVYDRDQRRELYRDIQMHMHDNVYQIPLFFQSWNAAVHEDVVAQTNLLGKPLFRQFEWSDDQ